MNPEHCRTAKAAAVHDNFLLRVDGRDSSKFKRTFARWLVRECPTSSVRGCLDAGPNEYRDGLRAKLLPVKFQRLLTKVAEEKDANRRANLFARAEKVLTDKQARRFSTMMHRNCKAFRRRHEAEWIRKLSRLAPVEQLTKLECVFKCEIDRAQVESDYYWEHSELRKPDQLATDLMIKHHLGGEAALSLGRKEIPDEYFQLRQLAISLACSPHVNALLCKEFADDAPALRRAVRELLDAYLHFLATRDRRALRRKVRGVAGRSASYAQLRRFVFLDKTLVKALWNFFDHEGWNALRDYSGLRAKLVDEFRRKCVPVLLRFLFRPGTEKNKQRSGLIHQWLEDRKDQSPYRRKADFLDNWEWQIKQKRAGVPEHEYALKVEALSGFSIPVQDSNEAVARADVFRKLRSRTFKLPLPR